MPTIPAAIVKPGYKPQSEDTSINADVLIFRLLRQLAPSQKAQRTSSFNLAIRRLAIAGIKNQYPNASSEQIRQEFVKRCLGAEWLFVLNHHPGGELIIQEPIELARHIADILEPLDIPYAVGGSVASSLLGKSRATQDLDLIIDISPDKAQQLLAAMQGEFYISESAISEAIASDNPSNSFNVIYLPSMEKADIFVLQDDPFSRSTMDRRQLYATADDPAKSIYIYSPEDIILQKLKWFRMNRRESEKQWRDVLGVMKIQGDTLDFEYLWRWAEPLDASTTIEQALIESGLL